MRITARAAAALTCGTALLATAGAYAHIGISEVGFAGKSQLITLNVGHGCPGADTIGVEVRIPKQVTSVRGAPNFFGYADVKTDAAGAVTSVVWTKQDVRDADDQFYQLQLRIQVPETPFEKLYFPTTQHCRAKDGTESKTEWTAMGEGGTEEPAPELLVMPPRQPGWNKYTAPKALTDLTVFDDAQIVWVGDAAYSANPETKAMIAAEQGVTELKAIDAKAEIWVKY